MAENRMELFIETLTGTAFELSCSPLETIVSIKAKIQYSEGIPVSQQHLIWKSQELNDDLCLQDYSINDGATLKLVLGMRGGPINTRQVSDSKKLKDLADYVERSSETAGSGGRPFTVLVFHDGDKVHMYTLMEKGECTVSPLSGTISETSSVASIKNVEELDQELARENEATREKIAQLQEQLRALNINKPKRLLSNTTHATNYTVQAKSVTEKHKEEFYLPPIKQSGALKNQPKQYLHKNAQTNIQKSAVSQFTAAGKSEESIASHSSYEKDIEQQTEVGTTEKNRTSDTNDSKKVSTALDYISNTITAYILASPNKDHTDEMNQSCSNFLPYISSAQSSSMVQKDPFPCLPTHNSQLVAVNMDTPCINSVIKYDPSKVKKTHKQLPFTSNQALSSRRFIELDDWLQNRPKTSPAKTACKTTVVPEKICKNKFGREDRGRRKVKHSIKNPLSMSLTSSEKSNLIFQVFGDRQDSPFSMSPPIDDKNKSINAPPQTRAALGTLVSSSFKALKPYSLKESEAKKDSDISVVKNVKSSKTNEDLSRPNSSKRLPVIKTKKKSYKRCSMCSKKTGLATSYTCRCGKNFCATHRYAEAHHCSYDYKTEGRRLLQLNNPVVTASKLPKI